MANLSESTQDLNGNPQPPNWSEAEYKKLCKQMKQFQTQKNGGKKRSKPPLRAIGEVTQKPATFKIQKVQSDWEAIPNYTPFALDLEATLIYIKIGKERAMCVNTMQSLAVASALVHRVFL
jgi:hypothetical protein